MAIVNTLYGARETLGLQELGILVAQQRGRTGLTQRELGDAIGRNQDWVSKLERGMLRDWPDPDTVAGIAEALGVPRERLLEALGYLESRETDRSASDAPTIYTVLEDIEVVDLPDEARGAIRDTIRLAARMRAEIEARNNNGTSQ